MKKVIHLSYAKSNCEILTLLEDNRFNICHNFVFYQIIIDIRFDTNPLIYLTIWIDDDYYHLHVSVGFCKEDGLKSGFLFFLRLIPDCM